MRRPETGAHGRTPGEVIQVVASLLGLCLAGCGGPTPSGIAASVLFEPGGKEYEYPGGLVLDGLLRADSLTRQKIEGELCALLEAPGGYSRLVAARALINFHDETMGKHMTDQTAETLARRVLHLADRIPSFVTDEALRKHPPYLMFRLRPSCWVLVEGRRYYLREGVPQGLSFMDAEVTLDGRVIDRLPQGRELGYAPVLAVSLWEEIPEEQRYQKHTVVTRLTILTPSGLEIPMSQTEEFTVETKLQMRERRLWPGCGEQGISREQLREYLRKQEEK